MATAPLSTGQNPLAGVAALLQTLGGTKTTTSPGDISYLQQVFQQGQQFNPQQLLQTVFQQAAGQIPGFQQAFGNAVGARSGGNSAVNAALQQLLMQTSLAGQEKVANQTLQNQQNQGQVAGSIATATRGQTQKQSTGLGDAAKLLALWQMAGKAGLIDGVGKTLGIPSSGGGGSAATGTASAPAPVATQNTATTSPIAPQSTMTGAALPTLGADVFSQPGMGSMEWANGATLADGFASFSDMFADQANNLATMEGIDPMDALMGVTDGFGTITGGGSNFVDDLIGSIGSIFGFADGGLVGRDGQNSTDEEVIEDSAMRRYDVGNTNNQALELIRALMPQFADGGPVRGPRRTTQQANPLMSQAVNSPLTRPQNQLQQQSAGGVGNNAAPDQGMGEMGLGLSPGGNAGLSAGQAAAVAMGLGLLGFGPMGGIIGGMLSPTATPGSVLGNNISSVLGVPGIAVNAVTNALGVPADGFNSTAGISVGEPGVENAFGAISSPVDSPTIGPGIDLGMLGSDGGFGGGAGAPGTGATGGEAGADGSDGSAAAGVGVGASGAGEASDGLGFKSGGEVNGPGTGTSDSIIARLSDGEYVIPADVVDVIGVDFFDALRSAIHQPAAQARR